MQNRLVQHSCVVFLLIRRDILAAEDFHEKQGVPASHTLRVWCEDVFQSCEEKFPELWAVKTSKNLAE